MDTLSERSEPDCDPSTDDELLTHSEDAPGAKKEKTWSDAFAWSRDTKNVFFWMLVVLCMIGVTAAIVLTFTISFLSNEETSEFENGVS